MEAVQTGQFHVHAIDTIDQALEILMARPVGTLDKKGRYSKNSIYAAVMEQLEYWQAIEDGETADDDEPKKKKKRKRTKKDETATQEAETNTAAAKTLSSKLKRKR